MDIGVTENRKRNKRGCDWECMQYCELNYFVVSEYECESSEMKYDESND